MARLMHLHQPLHVLFLLQRTGNFFFFWVMVYKQDWDADGCRLLCIHLRPIFFEVESAFSDA